jgi:hypothetical protein
VNAPHAVRLEPENASGMTNFQGVCWYRRHITALETWKGKKIFVEFEGAMQVADVWFNGRHVLTHYGGYLPFMVDLTGMIQYGKADNVLALRLDNSDYPDVPPGKPQNQLDFTYLGGLYRNVWMYVTDRLHVTDAVYANKAAGGGTFVTYPRVSAESATFENGQRPTRKWIPGEPRAEGQIGGKVVATHVVRTAGVPSQLALFVEDLGRPLSADGSDFVPVRAYVQDAHGTLAPLGDDHVKFNVTGEGVVIGDASTWANPMKAQAGIATALVRSTLKPGSITVTAEARGLKPATITLQSRPFTTPIVPGAK